MNKEIIKEELNRYNKLLDDCAEELKCMNPAFEFDTEEVEKMNKKYDDLLKKVDYLQELLESGCC